MKSFSIKKLAEIVNAQQEYRESSIGNSIFNGVSIDSRTTNTGDCFFAITGDNFDGHDFIADAFEKGAVCAVVSKDKTSEKFPDRCILKVKNTIRALGQLAKEYRRQMNFKVVAITGSVGKTTTRQIAYHVLSQSFRLFQAPKNFNNNIGLPLTLLSADPEDEIIMAEIGTNSPGEISCLTQIALPNIAVITNVQPAHLAGFGNLQAIINEKSSIAEGLPNDGALIINGDYNELVDSCRSKGLKFITFGKTDQCNIQTNNVTFSTNGCRFTIEDTQINLPLLGQGNIENALAAWSICKQLGIDITSFARAAKTTPAVPMRAELMQIGTLTVINDCYNANPASMKNALGILTNLKAHKTPTSIENPRQVFICADMAELGQQSSALHSELGTSIAQTKIQLLLAVGEFAKTTADTAKRIAEHNLQVNCFQDTASLCNNLEKFIKNYDIVLVKGSRTTKLETAVEKLKELFLQSN